MSAELKSVQLLAVGGLVVLRALVRCLHLTARLVIMRRALTVLGAVSPIHWERIAVIADNVMAQVPVIILVQELNQAVNVYRIAV